MKAIARIYWTFFTALKVQRWLAWLGLVWLAIGVWMGVIGLLTDRESGMGFPFGLAGFLMAIVIPTAFAVGGIVRALSAPQGHQLLPYFRVRVLAGVALFVGSIVPLAYAAAVVISLNGPSDVFDGGRVAAGTVYGIGALTTLVLSVFVITAQPNWSWATLPAILVGSSWLNADGPNRLAAAGVSLPWIVGVASLGAWSAFAIWYLRARHIRPVLLITATHGWTEIWRRQADRQQKRWPAKLTRGSALGILLWSGRVQPALSRQLLNAAGLGVVLCLAAPLLKFLPSQATTTPAFTKFVWPFYAMLFTSFATLLIVQQSRRAWLCVPGPRVRVFRAVEWEMARFYLRAVTCIAALVLASLWVLETPPTEAAWAIALMASAALYSACLGLASVRTAWPVLFGLFGMLVVQGVLLDVVQKRSGIQQPGALLVIQLGAAAVLRVVAEFRWRSIDWIKLRPMRLGRSPFR